MEITLCLLLLYYAQIGYAKELAIVTSYIYIYISLKYSKNYFETSRSLWEYFRDKQSNPITNSSSFEYKAKIIGSKSNNNYNKKVQIVVVSKYVSNFCRYLELFLINCEANLMLTWSKLTVVTDIAT